MTFDAALPPRVPAVLALGSNLGDRAELLEAAATDLAEHPRIEVLAVSDPLETVAVRLDGPDPDAPGYLNGVVLIATDLAPHALLDATAAIEAAHGRVREERWGDRTLDIDIVDYDHRTLADERLELPHPRAVERSFVLEPWLQVDPDAELVGRGRVADLVVALRTTAEGDRA